MSYQSYQVATDGAPTDTSNLIPEGPPKASYREASGAVSLDAEGNVNVNKPRSYNTAEAAPQGATGILATAKTVMGSPCMGPITAKDIITINGMEVAVGTAEMMGMVHKDVMGRYVETSGGVDQAKAGAEAENQRSDDADQGEGFADPTAERAMKEVCDAVSPGLQVSALQEIITDGQASRQTIERAASEAGIEPSQMTERLSSVVKSFETQARQALTKFGSEDPDGFFEWAQTNQPRSFKEAMQRHGMERTTQGYEPMYREYIASMAHHDPKSVLNAKSSTGVTVQEVNGEVLVTIPGKGQYSYRSALSAGLIKVRGA